jgi:hypothetical protein
MVNDRYRRMQYLSSAGKLPENSMTSSGIAPHDNLALAIKLSMFGLSQIEFRQSGAGDGIAMPSKNKGQTGASQEQAKCLSTSLCD